MASTFVEHHMKNLFGHLTDPTIPLSVTTLIVQDPQTQIQHLRNLDALFNSLKGRLSPTKLRDGIKSLVQLSQTEPTYLTQLQSDSEELVLRKCIQDKIILGLYSESLDCFLSEAIEAEAEAEWWTDIECSRLKVALYLLQTSPFRFLNMMDVILHTFRARDLPIRPHLFTPSSLRRIFPSPSFLRPNVLLTALFPHLHDQPVSVSLAAAPARLFRGLTFLAAPLELTREECRLKRKMLEKTRDERAEVLGRLVEMRDSLTVLLDQDQDRQSFLAQLQQRITNGFTPLPSPVDSITSIQSLASTLTAQTKAHATLLTTNMLLRPSRLTRLWPRILLIPPLLMYAAKTLYSSRESLAQLWEDTKETGYGFLRGWLFEPLREIVKTVRAGGEEGVIIRKEAVGADIESLERMTLSLARDKLHYDAAQLQALSEKIQVGDLTPVLEIYEKDIKSPLKSALTGTLLRSVFIQVQKAKVDIDRTLTGIDKLLRSQELTFAFVGVAPSLAIVYFLCGYTSRLLRMARRPRFGGSRRQKEVWTDMRRIERLLISQPRSSHTETAPPASHTLSSTIPPLTTGLLLLSLTRLRTFALSSLPSHSQLQEGFLEDVEDLEDPGLGRGEKIRVVDRMWRCWGVMISLYIYLQHLECHCPAGN